MDWLDRMNNSLNYLEANMENRIEIDEVAKVAYSSKFHYQRMFHLLTGITVAEYIRNRRLTLAAYELTTSDVKVIDVAFKYGYDSPESFSRAFLKYHGVNPSKVKNHDVSLIAFPKFSFQIYLKGDKQMDYRIIEKETFKVIGMKREVTTKNGENFSIVPQFWAEVCGNGTFNQLQSYSSNQISYGICMDFILEEEKFNYLIGVDKLDKEIVGDFEINEIPAHTWAVFDCIGKLPQSVQKVVERVHREWFPATGYEQAEGPEVEVYFPGDTNSDNYKAELWIPIIKK